MSRILIAWELGGGYGHLASLAPFARRLIERGHQVYLALRDLSRAELMLGGLGCTLLQAPIRQQIQVGLHSASTYSELLALVGYLDGPGMTGLIKAWRGLFDLVRPDVLIAEHAPTALLAARGLNLHRVVIGNGFVCPPPTRPMPALSLSAEAPDAARLEVEARVLENVNGVLARIGAPPMEALGDLYVADDQLLCTFEDLDPFAAHRPGARYAGPRGLGWKGVAPRWPARGTQRVFAYLKAEASGFEALVRHLSTSPEAVLMHVPGMPARFVDRFSSPSLALSPEPVNVSVVAGECDGAICPAGQGTICHVLLAGCPVLLIPAQLEQRLMAERVATMGAGLMADPSQGPPPYPSLIRRLLTDAGLRAGARSFAERHGSFDERRAVVDMVRRTEALVAAT